MEKDGSFCKHHERKAGILIIPYRRSTHNECHNIEERMAKVGIFFFINSKILVDAVSVENGEPYGDAIQYGEHYNFWDLLIPRNDVERAFKGRAYDAYPRGRVIFFSNTRQFCVYVDRCLKKKQLGAIFLEFGLETADVKFDAHYKCARCNPHF